MAGARSGAVHRGTDQTIRNAATRGPSALRPKAQPIGEQSSQQHRSAGADGEGRRVERLMARPPWVIGDGVGERFQARHVGAGQRDATGEAEAEGRPEVSGEHGEAKLRRRGEKAAADVDAPWVHSVGVGDQYRHADRVAGLVDTADPPGLGRAQAPQIGEQGDEGGEGHRPRHAEDLGTGQPGGDRDGGAGAHGGIGTGYLPARGGGR